MLFSTIANQVWESVKGLSGLHSVIFNDFGASSVAVQYHVHSFNCILMQSAALGVLIQSKSSPVTCSAFPVLELLTVRGPVNVNMTRKTCHSRVQGMSFTVQVFEIV